MSATRTASAEVVTSLVQWLAVPLAVLFVVAVPLCFVGNNVRWVTLDPNTYRSGFERYQVTARTGLDAAQLEQVARAFIAYFQGPPGELNPTVTLNGVRRPLFNDREVAHMVDVQKLMQLVFRLGLWSGLYLAVLAVAILAWQGSVGLATLGRLMLWGSAVSFALLLAVGALSFVDFGELFVRFHELSFRNDLWMLDPRRDYLLMLFPEGFWFDVTLKIAALTAAESAVFGVVGFVLARR